MAWKELNLMQTRQEFILRAKTDGVNLVALCREFGISRKTAYKWLKRYEHDGFVGLANQSRRPKSLPAAISGEIAADIVRVRRDHPRWGPRKIAAYLQRKNAAAPSVRTIARILERAGLVQLRSVRRCHAPNPTQAPRFAADAPNDVWTVDYKGWWISSTGQRWEPLTIRDAHSRYILCIELLNTTRMDRAKQVFTRVFKEYGLPKAILTDNGTPFAARFGKLGFTALSAWWMSLGIEHLRSRPGKPQDNGGHERMHREMKADLKGPSGLARRNGAQDAWEQWRNEFNTERPHESLKMKTPSEVYRKSRIRFEDKPVLQMYPSMLDIRLVDSIGKIAIRGEKVFISHALKNLHLALERSDSSHYNVWFGAKQIGQVQAIDGRQRFVANI